MARNPPPPRGPRLELAGDLSVAFVNTAGAKEDNSQQGAGNYAELLAWARAAGVLSTPAAERPDLAEEAWARAKKQRSILFRLFLAVMAGKELAREDLDAIDGAHYEALAARRMIAGVEGVRWFWAGDEDALDRMLWPVLDAAVELLISLEGRPQVRQCAAKGCTLFFVDRSKKQRKRWCEMRTCGRRTKSLDYYYRTGRAARMASMDRILGPGRRRRRPSKPSKTK